MKSINVEQAIFASSDRGQMKGYQLVASSPGIDRATSQELCRWAPTQVRNDNPDHWTLNYFPLTEHTIAVTRTMVGGPEYSDRGATHVVTQILVLRNEQFAHFSGNAIAVATTALALGYLRLPLDSTFETLPQIELPILPVAERTSVSVVGRDGGEDLTWLDEISELAASARRVAVVGVADPIAMARRLIDSLPIKARRHCSFTTGLTPTVRRPFQLHFLPAVDALEQRSLDAQGIVLKSVPAAASVPAPRCAT